MYISWFIHRGFMYVYICLLFIYMYIYSMGLQTACVMQCCHEKGDPEASIKHSWILFFRYAMHAHGLDSLMFVFRPTSGLHYNLQPAVARTA